jgi:alkyl hydroperoxide reductase subunit AhpF
MTKINYDVCIIGAGAGAGAAAIAATSGLFKGPFALRIWCPITNQHLVIDQPEPNSNKNPEQ